MKMTKSIQNNAKKLSLVLVLSLLMAGATNAQQTTYANPIDIDYRFNFEQEHEAISYRTGADPAVVRHQGSYYLFETLADGYWRSTDLINWTFITPSKWPAESIVAPAVISDGNALYVMPSHTRSVGLFKTSAPETGKLDYWVRRSLPVPTAVEEGREEQIRQDQIQPSPWDPGLFIDDDGKWYMYWGSSNVYPLYGIEMNANPFAYKGTPNKLFKLDPAHHGWERFGQDHSGGLPDGTKITPFIEGAWMTKVGGKYYLQYGAPGTEYNAYANGVYVSDAPLGPFTYADYNPIAYKPGGFVEGAGHGSTFEDNYGNYWNTGTPWIGYNWTFERRIAMFPAAFSKDGQMSVSTRFGDFPHFVPKSKFAHPDDLFTGWMLLSYRKAATASSSLEGFGDMAAVTDENPRTFWVAATKKAGEALTLDLEAVKTVRAIQVNFADYKAGRYADADDIYTEFDLQASIDGQTWQTVAKTDAPRRDRPNAYFELKAPVEARYIRYVHGHIGGAYLAISDLRVFGNAAGQNPKMPKLTTAKRDNDERNAHLIWTPVEGAVGYNIMWGVKPDRLNLTYQVMADEGTVRELRALNTGVSYYVAIEAFNEVGVSKRSRPIKIR